LVTLNPERKEALVAMEVAAYELSISDR